MSHIVTLIALKHFSSLENRYRLKNSDQCGEKLELVLAGRALLHHHGQTIYIGTGDVVWLRSDDQTVYCDSVSDDYECLVMSFQVNNPVKQQFKLHHWYGVISLRQFADDALSQFELKGHEPEFSEYLYSSCKIHGYPLSGHTSILPFASERAFNQAYQFMAQNYKQPSLTVGQVANSAHISCSLLHVIFKQRTGLTPHQKLIQFRMEHSLMALFENRPMKQVATMSGFSSESGFSRAFKKHYGQSPFNYRLQFKTQKDILEHIT